MTNDWVGVYVAFDPEDGKNTTLVFGDPLVDIPKIVRWGSLRAKPIGEGVNLEKANGRVAGITIFPHVKTKDGFKIEKIGVRELAFLEDVLQSATQALRKVKTKVARAASEKSP